MVQANIPFQTGLHKIQKSKNYNLNMYDYAGVWKAVLCF